MVSNLKIIPCIQKLWPGQENPHARTSTQTLNSHCGDYVELATSRLDKNVIINEIKQRMHKNNQKESHLSPLVSVFKLSLVKQYLNKLSFYYIRAVQH